jgi:hypothetical protein
VQRRLLRGIRESGSSQARVRISYSELPANSPCPVTGLVRLTVAGNAPIDAWLHGRDFPCRRADLDEGVRPPLRRTHHRRCNLPPIPKGLGPMTDGSHRTAFPSFMPALLTKEEEVRQSYCSTRHNAATCTCCRRPMQSPRNGAHGPLALRNPLVPCAYHGTVTSSVFAFCGVAATTLLVPASRLSAQPLDVVARRQERSRCQTCQSQLSVLEARA